MRRSARFENCARDCCSFIFFPSGPPVPVLRAAQLRAENDRLRRSLNSQPTTAAEWKQNTAALRSMGVEPPPQSSTKHAQWKF